jgi:HPt (histidine-containing phosphotransfer) domain-containing protein
MGNTHTDAQETKDIEVDEDFQKNLKLLFVKGNQNKYEEIIRALKENNIKLANRLAHTLKSNAGQIGKTSLQQAAADVEQQLKDGKNLATEEQLKILETELSKVLDELSSVHKEYAGQPVLETKTLDPKKVQELIEKLEPLLESGNLQCLDFVKDIRVIPGSEGLIQKMEDFEFEDAAVKLAELKKELSI